MTFFMEENPLPLQNRIGETEYQPTKKHKAKKKLITRVYCPDRNIWYMGSY